MTFGEGCSGELSGGDRERHDKRRALKRRAGNAGAHGISSAESGGLFWMEPGALMHSRMHSVDPGQQLLDMALGAIKQLFTLARARRGQRVLRSSGYTNNLSFGPSGWGDPVRRAVLTRLAAQKNCSSPVRCERRIIEDHQLATATVAGRRLRS